MTHYTPSGKVDTVRAIGAFLVAAAVVVVLSFAYNAINSWMPFIYLSALICLGYGIGVGILTRMVMSFGKFRNKTLGLAVAVALGLLAVYTAWMAYLAHVSSDMGHSFTYYLSWLAYGLEFKETFAFIGEINSVGLWTIGSGGSVSGIFLGVVWAIEAIIILGVAPFMVFSTTLPPFSESQDKFFDEVTLNNNFQSLLSGVEATSGLKDNALTYLKSIELSNGYPYSRVSVFTLPRDSEAYISVNRIRVDEKNNEVSVPVVEHLRISGMDAREVLDAYKGDKDKIGALLT